MLSAPNRLRSSNDFARVTKTGQRASTASLVVYLKRDSISTPDPQIGLIVSKAIGGSVTRHRIARQLRHVAREHLESLPPHSQMVVRVIKGDGDYRTEFARAISKLSMVVS